MSEDGTNITHMFDNSPKLDPAEGTPAAAEAAGATVQPEPMGSGPAGGESADAESAGGGLLGRLHQLRTLLADPPRQLTDSERIDLIAALEELKNTACAAQARISVDLDASQRATQAAAGVPAAQQGRGVASQVGLARRESAHRGSRHLGLGKVLVAELPHTLTGMGAGWISEWRTTLIARETACLSAEHRAQVDAELCRDRADQLQGWGDARLVAEVRKLAYRLEPKSVLARIRNAAKDRAVTCRPAPDTMAYLTALLPADKAVACYAGLAKAANTARAAGDPRTRGQVMADTLVQLLTGKKTPDDLGIEIELVVTDQALFANATHTTQKPRPAQHPNVTQAPDVGPAGDPREEPGWLRGYGTVPAGWVRDLIAGLPPKAKAWVRRLYRHPLTGQLVALDSKRRTFKHGIRQFTVLRDQLCRTPWCDAPIRHVDHPFPVAEGGETSNENSQGLCEACNYAKEAPGWTARPMPGPVHTVVTTTPTGHVYHSTAPPLPGQPSPVHPDAEPDLDAGTALPLDPLLDPPDEAPAPAGEIIPVDPLDEHDRAALLEHLLTQYAA